MNLVCTPCFLISVIALSSFSTASAQFTGGDGDGATAGGAGTLALGHNIFRGGNDDGNSLFAAAGSALGRNIFAGGPDDGNTLFSAAGSPLGRNIFTGGSDDGTTVFLTPASRLGRNIFAGGNDDGFSSRGTGGQPLGRNIFTGGNDDGWAMSISQGLLLPVTLLTFTGHWQGNDAGLQWQTGSEVNTAYFELQRSLDGNHFTRVDQLPAAGQSNTPHSYLYTDKGIRTSLPAASPVYYRLCTTDKNGAKTYSAVVILTTAAADAVTYAVFPNPARDIITVTCTSLPAGGADLVLTDANGKTLIRQKMKDTRQPLSVTSLAAGTYYLQLSNAGTPVYRQKIVVVR